MSSPDENHPLLPPTAHPATTSRSKLGARRYLPDGSLEKSEKGEKDKDKGKGKQRGESEEEEAEPALDKKVKGKGKAREEAEGRAVTIVFSDDTGNLDVWVDEGESVGHVKDKIRQMRPNVSGLQLRLIYAGRLLTDGILLLPWLRSLEERVRRQAAGVGGDVGEVLREVGLADEEPRQSEDRARANVMEKVYLHCNVGGPLSPTREDSEPAEEQPPPRRRGFDTLLDAGLSAEEVANMRRQFYASRGEEVPDLGSGDVNDEHARALEEQWIEGDLTPATATTTLEGMYTSILNGLLIGFLVPLTPWFFFRDAPLPNFFDAEAEADERARREEAAQRAEEERRAAIHAAAMGIQLDAAGQAARNGSPEAPPTSLTANPNPQGRSRSGTATSGGQTSPEGAGPSADVSSRVSASPLVGGELVPSVVFSSRTQIGIVLGTFINILFGALRFLS